MRKQGMRSTKRNSGNVVLELAIATPLLLLMMVGSADFARVFYHAVTLANAAGTGAFYGTQNNATSGHFGPMEQKAQEDARDIGTITAQASRYCECPVVTGVTLAATRVDCVTGTCAGDGPPRVYVSVKTKQSFTPLVKYPGVPNPVAVGRTAYMRVQ